MTLEDEAPFVSHLPSQYGSVLLYFHTLSQLPVDQINLLCLLFLQAFFGSVYRRLQNPLTRQLFGFGCGIFLIWALYATKDALLLILYISSFYPIIFVFNLNKKLPRVIFWLAMGSLCLTFAYMTWFYYLSWRLDITTSMMGVVVRIHSLSWDVVDGKKLRQLRNKVDSNGDTNGIAFENGFSKSSTRIVTRAKEIDYRLKHGCIKDLSFFDYLCYMIFFIHILCGSNLTINEYLQLTDRSLFKLNGWRDNKNDPCPRWIDILRGLMEILFVAGLFLFGKIFLPLCSYCGNIEFYNSSFWFKKWYFVTLAVFFMKFKYHFGWKCLDLSCLTSGGAFSGVIYDSKNGNIIKIEWNRARNINSFSTALPNETAMVVRNWNMTVNDWLTNYVFARAVAPKFLQKSMGDFGSKVLITRLTSAFYHGIYPGYYVFFFYSKFCTDMLTLLRSILPTYEDFDEKDKFTFSAIMCYAFWTFMTVINLDSMGTFFLVCFFVHVLICRRVVCCFVLRVACHIAVVVALLSFLFDVFCCCWDSVLKLIKQLIYLIMYIGILLYLQLWDLLWVKFC